MKCFGFILVYMSSILIAIFNIVFGFSDLIYMIHAYSKLDNLGKRFHLSFFDIQCPSNFLHLWLSQKKGENYITVRVADIITYPSKEILVKLHFSRGSVRP